jgi:hypothetical protein
VSGARIREMLAAGSLADAIRELKSLEAVACADDTNSVLLSANLERLRWRSIRQLIAVDDLASEMQNLVDRIRSVAESLEEDIAQSRRRETPDAGELMPAGSRSGGTPSFGTRSTSVESTPETTSDASTIREVLLLVHGIHTHAVWFEMVNQVMSTQVPCQVVPIKYGYFDALRFLLPFGTRGRPIQKVREEIRKTKTKYPNATISVIAHSFGTYALMHAIRDPSFELARVILCGSVLPAHFNIERYFYTTENTRIVNDCGVHDIWPIFAQCFTWGYGATGTFGIGTVVIRDRLFPFSHSDFFQPKFVSQYWVPFIRDGSIVTPAVDGPPLATSRWLSLLSSEIVSGTIRLATSFFAVLLMAFGLVLLWFQIIK